jgi:hypothetical protein
VGPATCGDLGHVADPWPGEEHAARLHGNHGERPQVTVEEHDVDREPHPERVDRATPLEQEALVPIETISAEQAPPTGNHGRGDAQREAADRDHPGDATGGW